MKRLLLFLTLIFFGLITSQFSLANSNNTADLIRQVMELNQNRKVDSKKYYHSTELTDTTAYKPGQAPTSTLDSNTIIENGTNH
jgi:hypothetical protein